MAHAVKLTANFERNLADIEAFLENDAPQEFDALLEDLSSNIIPNLERFPDIGRSFLRRQPGSAEAKSAIGRLREQLGKLSSDAELREYVTKRYLLLYARAGSTIYLLSIRHHRQLSFDLHSHWLT